MSDRLQELISILAMFEDDLQDTGQGWIDLGMDLCEQLIEQFEKEDWSDLIRLLPDLSRGQVHLVTFLVAFSPVEYAIVILEYLLAHLAECDWYDAAVAMGELYISDPEVFSSKPITSRFCDKFESEIRQFINFKQEPYMSFEQYIKKYAHLLDACVIEYYDYIRCNKQISSTSALI